MSGMRDLIRATWEAKRVYPEMVGQKANVPLGGADGVTPLRKVALEWVPSSDESDWHFLIASCDGVSVIVADGMV